MYHVLRETFHHLFHHLFSRLFISRYVSRIELYDRWDICIWHGIMIDSV